MKVSRYQVSWLTAMMLLSSLCVAFVSCHSYCHWIPPPPLRSISFSRWLRDRMERGDLFFAWFVRECFRFLILFERTHILFLSFLRLVFFPVLMKNKGIIFTLSNIKRRSLISKSYFIAYFTFLSLVVTWYHLRNRSIVSIDDIETKSHAFQFF